jgi:hypothetical protein
MSTSKIFSSSSFRKAITQAAENGYTALEQPTRSIVGQSAVTVVKFRPAAEARQNWAGKDILGSLQVEQVRQIVIDQRTQEERMTGQNSESVKRYDKRLVAFMQVTELATSQLAPGTKLDPNFYIAEAITYSPVYEGHQGIVVAEGVIRYSEKFICEITKGTPKRLADVLLLTAEQHATLLAAKRAGLFSLVQEQQMAAGLLTDAMLEAADAAANNNKPATDPEPGANSPAATDQPLLVADEPINSTAFGSAPRA